MNKKQTKQEKREIIAKKIKAKQKRGATLAGQISRTQSQKKYAGSAKKFTG